MTCGVPHDDLKDPSFRDAVDAAVGGQARRAERAAPASSLLCEPPARRPEDPRAVTDVCCRLELTQAAGRAWRPPRFDLAAHKTAASCFTYDPKARSSSFPRHRRDATRYACRPAPSTRHVPTPHARAAPRGEHRRAAQSPSEFPEDPPGGDLSTPPRIGVAVADDPDIPKVTPGK